MLKKNIIALSINENNLYDQKPPFNPPIIFPEYKLSNKINANNSNYEAVRNCFFMLGMDSNNYGKTSWNPLGELIKPGNKVLIKPNLISHQNDYNHKLEYTITQGSIIRAVIDYVFIALAGYGEIIVADAPQEDSDIEIIKKHIGIDEIKEVYWDEFKYDIKFIDFRDRILSCKEGIYTDSINQIGDPKGQTIINLKENSYFYEIDEYGKRYYGSYYDINETNIHHKSGVHEYSLSNTAIESDVFINIPKMKTHKKVGLTINLKGIVGICTKKNWLPHYALGSPQMNGDQFPNGKINNKIENAIVLNAKKLLVNENKYFQVISRKLKSLGYKIFGDTKKVIRSGNWYGNDTCWRMCLDINRALIYYDRAGNLKKIAKKYLSIVDGIIGMDGDGPVAGNANLSGVIIAGTDPAMVDIACAGLIGFDYKKIPLLYRAFDKSKYPISECNPNDIEIICNRKNYNGGIEILKEKRLVKYEAPFGWKGHIEI